MTENIYIAKVEIERILADYAAAIGEDEDFKLDVLEGQTRLFEFVRLFLGRIEDDEGVANALKQQIADRQSRKERAEHRVEASRRAIGELLAAAKLDKLALPEATISTRFNPGRPKVADPDLLPDDCVRIERKPDMAAIKERADAGELPPGVTLGNGSMSLTVRRK